MNIVTLYQTDIFCGGGTVLESAILAALGLDGLSLSDDKQEQAIQTIDMHVSEVVGLPYASSYVIGSDEFMSIMPSFIKAVYPDHYADAMQGSLCDDHITRYDDRHGRVLFYKHWVEGDCGVTYFYID